MGKLSTSIEMLNAEYRNRVSLSSFGQKVSTLKLLSDSLVVRRLFEELLEKLRQSPHRIEEKDFDFLGWADETRWQKPQMEEDVCWIDNGLTQQLAYCLVGEYGEKMENMNYDVLDEFLDGLINMNNVEKVIEENISIIRKTLVDIHHFKKNHRWGTDRYEMFYQQLHDEHQYPQWDQSTIKEQHDTWLNDLVGEPDMEDLQQRRRELLISLFASGFLDEVKKTIHVPASDDLHFGAIKDEDMMPDLNDTLKWLAALKKLCPLREGKFHFDEHAKIGKYIYANNISHQACLEFFHYSTLIDLVQTEMEWLAHPETKPQGVSKVVRIFVERVKLLMNMAAKTNNTIKTLISRGHAEKYLYNVDTDGIDKLMDELLATHEATIKKYLGDATDATADTIKYVAPFIGFLLDTHLYTAAKMPKKELDGVFQKVYGSNTSAVLKMSNKYPSNEAKILFDATEKVIEKHKKP